MALSPDALKPTSPAPAVGDHPAGAGGLRHDWTRPEIEALYALPFNDLLFRAHTVHRQHFDPNAVQVSTLLSIKTGACPEDCKYCSQSGHYNTGLEKETLLEIGKVVAEAKAAKEAGSSRFCMGAAWRSPREKDMPHVLEMVRQVKALGMETCMTLGMLTREQTQQLAEAGLDYYNHNLDTSPEFYNRIITTRSYQDRLDTLAHVREAGMKVCAGGIIGMGESRQDRIGLLQSLANLPQHPESVPINKLVKIAGTPLDGVEDLEPLDFVRMIAVARILMPKSFVRLSAGRESLDDATQGLCFFAGANSIFYGCRLLTTTNKEMSADQALFAKLGLHALDPRETSVSDDAEAAALAARVAGAQGTGKPIFYDAMQGARQGAR